MLLNRLSTSHVAWGSLLLSWALLGALGAGCSASDGGGGGKDGADGDVDGLDPGTDSLDGVDGSTGGTGTGPNGEEFCSEAPITFVPRTPTVFILVDRSGSVFDINQWTPLRDKVLPVIQELQADVRFGLGAYNSIDGACADVIEDQGTISLNNYDALATFYNGLSTTKPSGKLDTPTSIAVEQAAAILAADNGPGAKAILLVTADDDPDFCDDVGPDCGNDGAIGAMQAAHALGIQTFVFALDNADIAHKDWLDFWAQAGSGQEPNWTTGLTKDQYSGAVFNACNGNSRWQSAWTAAGRSGFDPIGTYSTAGGTATAFVSADTTAVSNEIRSKVEGLKSCIQDLSSENFAGVKEGAKGKIFLNNETTPIPDDQWRMNSPTVLELLGAACDYWKQPEVEDLFAGFACDQLVVR